MKTAKAVLLTLLVVVALGITGVYVFLSVGAMPANADAKPYPLERWAAKRSLHATIAREAPKGDNPVKKTDADLIAGIKLYAENCAVCHGAEDGKASNTAKGLYQRPPQLAEHGVEDDDAGETYWKIFHGIRLTGMPSYHYALSQHQIWQLTLFLQYMDQLPPKAEKVWKAVPSQAPKIKAEG